MMLDALHRASLRRTLLLVLLPGMLLLVVAELWLTWRTSLDAANAAYDRSLLGAIKAIDANISTESGGLSVELPYRMLEFFELTASGQVYYRVATDDALVEIGNADLPAPTGPVLTGQPQFADASYFGEPVRVGTYARMLNDPIGGKKEAQRVVIQVAETLGSRKTFTRSLVWQSVQRDLLLILLASVLLAAAIGWALKPLRRLHDEVRSRAPQDLAPLDTERIPADVRPLVDAINHHVVRNRALTEARRRFIDDASHQLRTPLATLATQVGYALREPDPQRTRDALSAVKAQLDEAVRQTNQMLSLARTDAVDLALEPVDLVALARQVTREWWPAAREAGIDLGMDTDCDQLGLPAHAALLREALSNLLHNAIRYTPRGGEVTVCVRRGEALAIVDVIDSGPGIPADELPRAGERFFRASNMTLPGSGLGLAIVRSIAQRHGGRLELAAGKGGRGLVVSIQLPMAG
ncbi:sensor histidine kinase N-terminal domain-containing protein [Variovorax sp. J22R133]|uniref:sensor histidine kinase n=1 Tax=Variovorax brevis TaxID=3053503 RepID=UPI0025776BB2|nr:sensor histidine kinase [Variovorax sp. J22R133]MDM0111987.1 sensor histidine kinase N-terminal domain-containing protein [Variovorax sp. J22R133]